MKILELLIENYKTVRDKWIKSGIDASEIDQTITQYRELVNLSRISGNQKNIDWWSKTPFAEFKSFVNTQLSSPSITQVKRKKVVGRSINVKETNDWLIVIPLDRDASCFHGKTANWCISKQNVGHFEDIFHYQKNILIFCINKTTNSLWALASDTPEIFTIYDQQNNEISPESFTKQTGINSYDLVKEVYQDHGKEIESELASLDAAKKYVKQWNLSTKTPTERDKNLENMLIKLNNMNYTMHYITLIGKYLGPQHFPEKLTRVLFDQPIDADVEWEDYYNDLLKTVVKYIKDPSEPLQLLMVQRFPMTVQYLENPGLKVQLYIVKNAPVLFDKIKNQKEQAQLAVIDRMPDPEKVINNPTEKVQLALVKKRPLSLRTIKNPSEAVKIQAIKSNGFAVVLVKDPTPEMIKLAVETTPAVIEKLKNPSVEIQLLAVEKEPAVVQRIRPFASKEAQIAAVKQYPALIYGIQNKFPETIELAREKGVDI